VLSSVGLSQRSGFDAIRQLFLNYSHLYYSVLRTDVCKKIWGDIKQLEILDLYLIELLQAELTLCHGKYVEVCANHYIRLVNPDSSSAKEATETDIPHIHKIYFDEKYRGEALRMSVHVASLLNVDKQKFLNEFKFFYIGRRLSLKIYDILYLQFRSRIVTFLPYVPLHFIIKLINLFSRGDKA
jgi:hypothetical protein